MGTTGTGSRFGRRDAGIERVDELAFYDLGGNLRRDLGRFVSWRADIKGERLANGPTRQAALRGAIAKLKEDGRIKSGDEPA